MRTQNDIRNTITNQIIAALERGCPPWRKPWNSSPNAGTPKNVVSKKSYSGVNPLLLHIAAERFGFTSRWWATFKQWKELGGQVMSRPDHVRPGEWGTNIVFCKPVTKKKTIRDGDEEDKTFWTLRSYTVFNVEQVSGDFDHLRVSEETEPVEIDERFEATERAIESTGADIRYGGDRAYYSPTADYIQMPHRHSFALPEYYDTLLHELSHWTEHPTRLNWDRSKPENTYALGELIAEISSCYLAGELGLPIEQTLGNHAAYLQGWLTQMKVDPRFIFRATSQATKAADYILSFSRAGQPEDELSFTA